MRKSTGCVLAALCLTLGMGMTTWAADTKIEKVEITFSQERVPESGEEPGNISATAGSDQYTVTDVYYTTEEDIWSLGDTPQVKATIYAASGYQFSSTSRSYFTISGCDAKFKKARNYDGRTTIELTVTLPRLKGKLDQVENAYWEDDMAVWDEKVGAKRYDLKLYRNEKLAQSVSTEETSYDFSDYFTKEGDYTFKVRAIARYDNRAGAWSEESDYNTITQSQAQTSGKGAWVQDDKGWWYKLSTGGYISGDWRQIDNAWYYFDRSGYMATGWKKLEDKWYYLAPNGVMMTGWQQIGGTWYYLDGSGVMQTGWQQIGGKRYYLDGSGAMLVGWQQINGDWFCMDSSGAMYASTKTPDGFTVDSWGVYRP